MALADTINALEAADADVQQVLGVLKPVQATVTSAITALQPLAADPKNAGIAPQLTAAITALQGI